MKLEEITRDDLDEEDFLDLNGLWKYDQIVLTSGDVEERNEAASRQKRKR